MILNWYFSSSNIVTSKVNINDFTVLLSVICYQLFDIIEQFDSYMHQIRLKYFTSSSYRVGRHRRPSTVL